MTGSFSSVCQSILTAPGTCPTSYSTTSSSDSTLRMFGSLRWCATQSVSTSTSGWAYPFWLIVSSPSGQPHLGGKRLLQPLPHGGVRDAIEHRLAKDADDQPTRHSPAQT